jgi:hypothetical protein
MTAKIVDDTYEYCALIDGDICEGGCYDVQMVRSKMIKESVLDFNLDRIKANRECDVCQFNQLMQPTLREASA